MLFNSLTFFFFFILIFILYWFAFGKTVKAQNSFLLVASYLFYGWWDWRFVLILFILSSSNYFFGKILNRIIKKNARKHLLIFVLIFNLSFLVYFKYFNFFIASFQELISILGFHFNWNTINIIVPIGLSFYTFLGISYIMDIYRRTLASDSSYMDVLLTLGFFPILLSGPIQRPASLLPQIKIKRDFIAENGYDGLRQILWGLFMKTVIADNLSGFVDQVFASNGNESGSTLLVGAVLFSIQIYCDFAGYSNMAIGISKLLGFNIMQNFAYPYFSRHIADFWKRWHISLTEWFRDYLFLPMAYYFSKKIKPEKIFQFNSTLIIYSITIFITFFLTGLWHGANYTYIVWGLLQAIFLIYHQTIRKPKRILLKYFGLNYDNPVLATFDYLITSILIIISWIFFRSNTIGEAFAILNSIFSSSLLSIPSIFPKKFISITIIFFVVEWFQRNQKHALQFDRWIPPIFIRWGFYFTLIFMVVYLGGTKNDFIYFQF